MGCCCNSRWQKIIIFGFAVLFGIAAIVLGIIWPSTADNLLKDELVLKEGTQNYNNWIVTPIPIYMEIFLFNWTNTDQYREFPKIKPRFEEKGPYVFREHHERVNLTWNANNTVSFNQTRTWFFEPTMSNGTLDDMITNLNVISTTVAYTMRNMNTVFKMVVNLMLNEKGGSLFVTKSVRELIFDGYDDELLKFLKGFNITGFNIPFERFGWFVDRNGSASYDGRFNIFTGADDISKLGVMDLWNNENRSPYYRGNCGMINGTTGELWPKLSEKQDITVFATDVCRSISLVPDASYENYGIEGFRWVGDERVFDNGINYPPASCWCTGEHCPDLPYGVMNVSDCKFGAPAFISYPHFYLAAPTFTRNIDGLNPNKNDHEFSIALEPSTGIPLQIKAQLQISLGLEPVTHLTMFEDVPKLMVPMLWFRQLASLNDELASDVKFALLLPKLGLYIAYGIGGLCAILLLCGIVLIVREYWSDEERMSLIPASSQNNVSDDDILR